MIDAGDKFNTRIKLYPDGNFISCTANRPHFLTRAQRIYLKLELEAQRERAKELDPVGNYEKLKTQLYGGGQYYDEFINSIDWGSDRGGSALDDIAECNEIVQSVLKKARRLGIPINGEIAVPKAGNIRRAREKIFDLIYLNDFKFFATFTYNPKKIDSYEAQEVMKTVKKWLNNHQGRNALQYVMIPELHRSGRIHLHMLYSGDLKLKDSGKRTKTGKPIFNCKSWRYGFSTVIPVDDNRPKLAFYVSKYVTKDVHKIFGKYYYSSQGLKRECPVEYMNRSFMNIQAPFVEVPAIDIRFKYESSIKFNSAEDNTAAILKELGVESA